MKFKNINIGFGITGSFCNFSRVMPAIEALQNEGANVLPILSHNSQELIHGFTKLIILFVILKNLRVIELFQILLKLSQLDPKG